MKIRALGDRYKQALTEYVDGAGEEALLHAYELGRQSLADGFGVLEIAALHQEALVEVVLEKLGPYENARLAKLASEFFTESLAAFEIRQRGIQEAYTLVRSLNRELEERVHVRTADLERALDELRSTTEQISEHERIEAMKDDFIATVSHELRTPLTSIHVSLALITMLLGEELSPRARELTDIACRNSQRLVRLIDSVLDLAKIEAGKLEFDMRMLELVPLVEHALTANESYASQFSVAFRLETDVSGALVNVDPDRLIQVITNLLSNAAKFSDAGQTVAVHVERRSGDLRVAIRDCGPGIPDEMHDRIFQKFARAAGAPDARDPGGTGLGLSISKSIIESMGGRIGFETGPGIGSTFYFDLPEVSEVGASIA